MFAIIIISVIGLFFIIGIIAYFALSSSDSDLWEDSFTFHTGRACNGQNEIYSGYGPTKDECAEQCISDPDCVSFEYGTDTSFKPNICQLSNSCLIDDAEYWPGDFDMWVKN